MSCVFLCSTVLQLIDINVALSLVGKLLSSCSLPAFCLRLSLFLVASVKF